MRRLLLLAILACATASGCRISGGKVEFDPGGFVDFFFPPKPVDPSKEPDGYIYKWNKDG